MTGDDPRNADARDTDARDTEARDTDRERSALRALTEGWARAIVANDADRIAAFMAEEWVMVSASGISSRTDFLAAVGSGDLTHSAMDVVSEPMVQLYPGAAVVTMRATNTAHVRGERFDADEWTTAVFVRRDGRWLCALSHITAAASVQ